VASTSKAKTIREFNHKNHYNEWQFIYDPTMDRGGLIKTPAQPALQMPAQGAMQPNSSGSGNSSGSSSPFGGMQSTHHRPSPASNATIESSRLLRIDRLRDARPPLVCLNLSDCTQNEQEAATDDPNWNHE